MKSIRSRIHLLTASLLFAAAAPSVVLGADTYKFDPVHTQVTFFVNHLGFSNSAGRFHLSDSTLQFDEKDWTQASVQATIQVKSLDMGDATWNDHLHGARFFETDKYPTITFKSTKVDVAANGQLKVTGDLTLRGVTKSVVLDTKVNKTGVHPMSKRPAAGFSAVTRIKRSDFGMSQMVPMISDEIDIRIEAEGSVPAAK